MTGLDVRPQVGGLEGMLVFPQQGVHQGRGMEEDVVAVAEVVRPMHQAMDHVFAT
jgi:hypothetical protein